MELPLIQRALREEGLGGWLFFDHHARDPLAYRILGLAPSQMATRRWYYLIPSEGEPLKLVHRIESGILDGLPGHKTVYSIWISQASGVQSLVTGRQRIAMQYSPGCAIPYVSMVDGGTLELIRRFEVEIVSSANLVQLFETRWTNEQLEMHLAAGRKVDSVRASAFNIIGESLRAGRRLTEWDVNRFIRSSFDSEGLFTDHGPIVAVNAHMSDPHYEPQEAGSAPIAAGDAVLIDMWAKLDRSSAVYYDITWTGYCGPTVPSHLTEVFSIVSDARDVAIEAVQSAIETKTPIRGYQVDDACRGFIRERGYEDYFVHRTGHSIGEDVHGAGANIDNLETHDDRLLVANTCFSIEPGVYLPEFGVRSEVNVFIGPEKAIVTGEIQRELVRML